MNSGFGHLKLHSGDSGDSLDHPAARSAWAGVGDSGVNIPLPDPHIAATRELIRPPTVHRGRRDCDPFTAAWYEELEQKRYQRHGAWLNRALEFGRHPGESLLLFGCGMGTDAVHYHRTGTNVTVAITPADHPLIIRDNFARLGLSPELVAIESPRLPFASGSFDVVTWNALYDEAAPTYTRVEELFRVLKHGGKLIGLFPARYDSAFWERILLPLQRLWWRRPQRPTTAPTTTAREIRQTFSRFGELRVSKRHLRRGELPHVWRILPLALLERLVGRVLVLKAKKPLLFARLEVTQEDVGRMAA